MITSDDKIKIKKLQEVGCSQKEISLALDIKRSTLSDFITGKTHRHKSYAWQVDPKDIKDEDRVVGCIPDLHGNGIHENAVEFLISTFESRGVNTIICLGDLIDNHRGSRYVDEQDALSFKDEYYMMREFLKEFKKIFPYGKLCIGNHESRIIDKVKANSIDLQAMRTLGEYTGLHTEHDIESWVIDDSFIIDGIKYIHKSRMGMHGAYNYAKEMGGSIVSAHTHINLGVRYLINMHGLYFGMDIGSLINKDHYSMRYSKGMIGELSLGCGVVYNKHHAEAIPMI